MLLRLIAPQLVEIERELERAQQRSARARRNLVGHSERIAQRTMARLRSPLTLAAAGLVGFASGRGGRTARRLRDIETQLEELERLIAESASGAGGDAQAHTGTSRGDGLDLQGLLATVTRVATLLSMARSASAGDASEAATATPDVAAAPDFGA